MWVFRRVTDGVDGDDLLAGLVHADRVIALNLNFVAWWQERVEANNETRVALEEG